MARLAMLLLAGVLCAASAPNQDLDQVVRTRFAIASAHPILQTESLGPQTRMVAERMLRYVRGGCDRTFVAEDGKAVATQVGTVDKLGLGPPALLTEGDKYRLLLADPRVVAYNVSQERQVGRGLWESSVPLRPLVLLDRCRTLCANGAPSVWEAARMPRRSLLLAIVDDRQRGERPNLARRVETRDNVGAISVVGVSGDWFVLDLGGTGRYLEVHGRTLATRSGGARSARTAQSFWADLRQIRRLHRPQEFVYRSRARWKGGSYYIASTHKPDGTLIDWSGCYVWDGKKLLRTDPWTVVASSVNGRYGWLLNRDTGQSWLITH